MNVNLARQRKLAAVRIERRQGQMAGSKEKKIIYYVLCGVAGMAALLPVSCDYILASGMVLEWTARMEGFAEGLRQGYFSLFPSAETILSIGLKNNGMNSNLWFSLPGMLYCLTGNMILAYRIYMSLVQVGTLLASLLFFRRIFREEETRLPELLGIVLYMTCPYRIFICYDYANLSQATAWMLLPLYLWAVMGILDQGGKRKIWNVITAALILAGVGYADVVIFVVLTGMTFLMGLIRREPGVFAALASGGVFFGPGLSRLIEYLFFDGFAELDMPLKSIMPNGYRVGEYFSSYAFRDGHPGMGIGMLTAILAGIWLWFVEGSRERSGICKVFTWLGGFFAVLSLRYFPWDLVERLGMWALKFVSLMDTPAFFAGMAFLCFSVPAAAVVHRISRHENKLAACAVPIIVVIACIGICVYQCNMLTYSRLPLDLG